MNPFEFDPERYREASGHQQEWGRRLLAELGLAGHERILDVGSGDGTLSRDLAAAVTRGSVLGIDASQKMVEAAKRFEGPNLRFLRLDVVDATFDGEFDVVFSNATLHWVEDHRRLLRILHRSVRQGGVVRLNFAGDGNCLNFIRVVREVMTLPEFAAVFGDFVWPWYMPKVEAYEALVRASPFADVRVWGEIADRHFPHLDALVGWIDQPSLVPFREHLEPDRGQADRFREEVIVRMIEATKQADGRYFETFRRINVVSRK
jgi:trans-aconitate methyltransferase